MLLLFGVWEWGLSAESSPFPGFSHRELEVYSSKDIHGSLGAVSSQGSCLQVSSVGAVGGMGKGGGDAGCAGHHPEALPAP